MLAVPDLGRRAWSYDNWGVNPSVSPGTSVVPGASNAEGSWTEVASAASIANDVCAIHVRVGSGFSATVAKNHLMDIGVDPAGGTSYTALISNIVCGDSTDTGPAHQFIFPIAIAAGSSIAVRVQGSHGTAGTVIVGIKCYGKSSRPEAFPTGRYSETIGTITNSNGVSFTPGNAADGSWVSLGTTTRNLWWWQLGYQIDNTTITLEYTFVELAFGDGSNKHSIMKLMHLGNTSEICAPRIAPNLNFFESYCPVPAGATIYVRGRCDSAPDTGYNAVAIAIGG